MSHLAWLWISRRRKTQRTFVSFWIDQPTILTVLKLQWSTLFGPQFIVSKHHFRSLCMKSWPWRGKTQVNLSEEKSVTEPCQNRHQKLGLQSGQEIFWKLKENCQPDKLALIDSHKALKRQKLHFNIKRGFTSLAQHNWVCQVGLAGIKRAN